MRIQEQVELVREQPFSPPIETVSSASIDHPALGGTSQWISEQQKIYGAVEDLLAEPPPLAVNMWPVITVKTGSGMVRRSGLWCVFLSCEGN
jgi:hypothetical protein